MIKGIIALDLDGTLLDAEGKYSLSTRDYLRKKVEEGFTIVLATGRPPRSLLPIYEDIRCNGPVIAYNGTLVYNPKDPCFPRIDRTFSKSAILRIYEKTKTYVDSYMFESADTIYSSPHDPWLGKYFPFEGMKLVEGDIASILKEDVYTALFHCIEPYNAALKTACEEEDGIAWRSWSNCDYSELFIPGMDKGHALSYIIQKLGVPKEDVYAFGDAENDISMLLESGHPYAMEENKVPHLMTMFEKTQGSAKEDGVLRTLQSIFKD
ncbi:MAG: HAD family phosphatase [Bacilli bacterium]|nr:HAD family phosphatase [Bacilli bacterium]